MSRLLKPSPQVTKSIPIPAPIAGINAVDGLAEMGPQDSILSYNLYPAQYGLKVRNGYVEWATNVGTLGGGRTIMPFKGSVVAEDVLFATSQEGIFDITASGSSFAAAVTFGTQNSSSGYGQYTNYTTIAGQFLLYCDEVNGYYYYAETSNTWSKPTQGGGAGQINGVDPATLVSVCNHKSRLWFVERGSGSAWYLPSGQVTGTVTEFNFGNRFTHGGYLVNLYTWTVDGGSGMDDYLVAISSSGDVLVFRGNDPSSATDWFQQGAWFVGRPPSGRRVAGSFGGELYILSAYGVLPLSRMMSGAVVQEQNTALSRRITPLIQEKMSDYIGTLGWEIQLFSAENLLIVSVPLVTGNDDIQFVQSLNTQGWGMYRNLPYFTGAEWDGDFYFGDAAGKIYVHTGTVDAVNLAGTSQSEIEFSLLTAFHDFQPQGAFKRVQMCRATFLAQGVPGYEITVRYDYKLTEGDPVTSGSIAGGALWNTALWDSDVWGGGIVVTQTPIGGSDMGRTVALALRGNTSVKTTLIRMEVLFDAGNFL